MKKDFSFKSSSATVQVRRNTAINREVNGLLEGPYITPQKLFGQCLLINVGELSYESGASRPRASLMWSDLSWGKLSLRRVVCNSRYR